MPILISYWQHCAAITGVGCGHPYVFVWALALQLATGIALILCAQVGPERMGGRETALFVLFYGTQSALSLSTIQIVSYEHLVISSLVLYAVLGLAVSVHRYHKGRTSRRRILAVTEASFPPQP